MSILIRKECQNTLNEADLSVVHVDVLNKVLTLVGPCGQPILPISGIRFATNNPTKTEIGYAVHLFNKFLSKHKEKIQEFIKAKQKASTLEFPTYEGIGEAATFHIGNVIYNMEPFRINLSTRGEINFGSTLTIENFKHASSVCEKVVNDYLPYLNAIEEYKNAEKELNKLQSELTKCNI